MTDFASLWAAAWPCVTAAVAVASALDALLPQPGAGSHWIPVRKAISFIAVNVGAASNGKQPDFATWVARILTAPRGPLPPALPLLALILAATIGLSACSSSGYTPPAPPATPTVADIATEQTAIAAYTGSAADLLNIGVELSDRWCVAYLNDLTRITNTTDFEATTATDLGTFASGVAAATGTSAGTTAILGALFPTLNQELTASGRMATAGQDPGVVYKLIGSEHAAYLTALAAPASLTEAVADIVDYAAYCQPAAIRSAVLQSGISATATSSSTSTSTSTSSSSATGSTSTTTLKAMEPVRGLHVPPVITIGHP